MERTATRRSSPRRSWRVRRATRALAAFLIKYQDRVLYGTDLDFLPDASPAEVVKDWQSSYARDWNFLATSETLNFRGMGRRWVMSLGVRRSLRGNAKPAIYASVTSMPALFKAFISAFGMP